jgi:predicted DCC family thiol-disulfide oxidoreductase YuxK
MHPLAQAKGLSGPATVRATVHMISAWAASAFRDSASPAAGQDTSAPQAGTTTAQLNLVPIATALKEPSRKVHQPRLLWQGGTSRRTIEEAEVRATQVFHQDRKATKQPQRIVLLFDGSCSFCTACAELLRLLDWQHGLHCLPFQAPKAPQSYGLTVAQCEQTVWAISADGHIYQGAQAASAALDAIVPVPVFLLLYRFPALKRMEDTAYAWVANHRRFFPGIRPYCERPGLPCGPLLRQ